MFLAIGVLDSIYTERLVFNGCSPILYDRLPLVDCEQSLTFVKVAGVGRARGEAASRDKRWRKPETEET